MQGTVVSAGHTKVNKIGKAPIFMEFIVHNLTCIKLAPGESERVIFLPLSKSSCLK